MKSKISILFLTIILTVSSVLAQRPDSLQMADSVAIDAVSVNGQRPGISKSRYDVVNTDNISTRELFRAACCNLGESFVTNPSVDVSYSDAATGAKQIKLLGLSGIYVQMLTENIPNLRGAASPYALGYIPGAWLQSIQVSKGTSSVKNGYEAISGQINVEYKKPQTEEIFSVNLYGNSQQRYEANADLSAHINDKLSTLLLAHYENETAVHDRNSDGFADTPSVRQVNLMNRWAYDNLRYRFQAGIKFLNEDRTSGQIAHSKDVSMNNMPRYKIGINTNRYEGYMKHAYIIDPERNSNAALIVSGTMHTQDATFGTMGYNVDQRNLYSSLLFESDLGQLHNLSTGLSLNYDDFSQSYHLSFSSDSRHSIDNFAREAVAGAYAQYTLNLSDRFTLMAGLRGDHSSLYGAFFTPRVHLKYNINEHIHLRASVGKGYRTTHLLAPNSYLFASSRRVLVNGQPIESISAAAQMSQEQAWNWGASVASYIPIAGNTLNLNAEFYYTNFKQQVVADMDSDPHAIDFVTLHAGSFSRSFQVEASYPFFRGFKLTGAYRRTDVRNRASGVMREQALVGRYKGLVTASYQTPLSTWQFDVTLGLNGGGRMPIPDGADPLWADRYPAFEQLSAQITRYFRHGSVYIGGENLTGFSQRNPIIDAANPWGRNFDSSMAWGPMHGAVVYIGVRFNLQRKE